jgi:hypothetical protein
MLDKRRHMAGLNIADIPRTELLRQEFQKVKIGVVFNLAAGV